jgi:hypothetical protein
MFLPHLSRRSLLTLLFLVLVNASILWLAAAPGFPRVLGAVRSLESTGVLHEPTTEASIGTPVITTL